MPNSIKWYDVDIVSFPYFYIPENRARKEKTSCIHIKLKSMLHLMESQQKQQLKILNVSPVLSALMLLFKVPK